MEQTDLITTAARFVNSTSSHIFLTGKAGTGKTTFLRDIAQKTYKRFVIVAPTGIAALNAKGVTIHSQFLLPFGSFIPVKDPSGSISDSGSFYTQNTLVRKHPINATRKNVLRDIDLLIIDEVSMLRADVLDAIDYRLRHARRNYQQAFGGVQLLMIGDLFQLPPIVKDHEWNILRDYYSGAWFFHSLALRESGFVNIELDKIFRQQDDAFIRILNHLRNDACTSEDLAELNKCYLSKSERQKHSNAITLTTHNNRANRMNDQALKALKGEMFEFKASVENDFHESMFPVNEVIQLKEGARIMFIKNDNQDGKFFNGKLATVQSLDKDEIIVLPDEEKEAFKVPKMVWENRKYHVDEESKELEETVIGTFTQYPIKTAWAITVHKSQGLTFEKAIIDVEQAFAAGQVYVALSRLRSLDGLILESPISNASVSTDQDVVSFSKERAKQDDLNEILSARQQEFLHDRLLQSFRLDDVLQRIYFFKQKEAGKLEFEEETMRQAISELESRLKSEQVIGVKFQGQLKRILQSGDQGHLLTRLKKGAEYFHKTLFECLRQLLGHASDVKDFTRTKTYLNGLMEIDQLLMKKLVEVNEVVSLCEQILQQKDIEKNDKIRAQITSERLDLIKEIEQSKGTNPIKTERKSGRKRKSASVSKPKKQKGETYKVTLGLIKEGKTIEEVAETRGMAISTIEGHAARLIADGSVDINAFLQKEEVQEVAKAIAKTESESIKETVERLGGNYSFGQVRMVQSLMQQLTEKESKKAEHSSEK
ncbi:MAG: helix-turn-helix domain-containing protein [Salibacteraceae bacterium]